MDHDCVPEQEWLKKMIAPFENPKVGVVSGYNYYGGTSTAFRREPLDKVGGYDLDYNYYREDTDLSFKIMDLGYDFVFVPDAKFEHLHEIEKPKGILGTIKHVLKRLRYHENDALLYKKHPTKVCGEFLGIHFGFLVSPMADFRVATGTWHKGGRLKLSSPRGITFLENKSFFHLVLIASFGIFYVVLVKLFRFLGSLKFGRLVL
jgi:GT2 family glycosyltransferase